MSFRGLVMWMLGGVWLAGPGQVVFAAAQVGEDQLLCDHACRLKNFRLLNQAGYHHLVYGMAGRYAQLSDRQNQRVDWRLIQMEARLKAGQTSQGRALAAMYAPQLPLDFTLKARGLLYYNYLVNHRYGPAEAELEKLSKNTDVVSERALLFRLTGREASLRQLQSIQREPQALPPPPARPDLFWFFTSSVFPGGGHLYQGNTRLFFLSFLTVGGLAGLGTFFAVDGQLVPAVISGYFALVFYQVSIVYGYRTLMEDYSRSYRAWENQLILQSKFRF